jgi:DNA-binding NtrC family response regulator
VSVIVPPLRERIDDIEPLARYFLSNYPKHDSAVPDLSEASLDLLESHRWPGNVRELRVTIELGRVMCEGPILEPGQLSMHSSRHSSSRRCGGRHFATGRFGNCRLEKTAY